MRTQHVLARWGRRSTLMGATAARLESVPPSLRHVPSSAWQRFVFWLLAPSPQDVSPSPSQVPKVRVEFLAALADIGGDEADRLRVRLHEALSLRELWHARSELFRVVGLAHSQAEAQQRLALVNRHFPTRAPRSQFVPL